MDDLKTFICKYSWINWSDQFGKKKVSQYSNNKDAWLILYT